MSDEPIINVLPVGMIQTNCIIVVCPETHEAMVVDPGDDADAILEQVDQLHGKLKYIVNTHSHPDHILANGRLKQATGALIAIHPLDAPALTDSSRQMKFPGAEQMQYVPADILLNEGDELTVGKIVFKVLHTPGHTRGHITLVTDGVALVGDVLFYRSIGRTDFPGGSFPELINSIRTKLFPLGDNTIVLPGHGPATTIGEERLQNPFLT